MVSDFFSVESDGYSEIRDLYQLIWQPLLTMHPSWWQKLELDQWQDRYQQGTILGNRIEKLVVTRRGIINESLPKNITQQQKQLLNSRSRMPELTSILGIFCLNCPEYLSLKSFRKELEELISPEQIQQAWALWPQRPTKGFSHVFEGVTPELLISTSQKIAIALLSSDQSLNDNVIWKAVSMTLPIDDFAQESDELKEFIEKLKQESFEIQRWLIRLERLL
ncbi:MAG: type III secretion system domain-containing protein [Parashewanella sp.]